MVAIGIISIKGGVGKTTATANLGAAFSSLGKKVVLIDANFSAPNLGLHFGLVKPQATILDALSKRVPVEKAIYEHDEGFHFIPGELVPQFDEKINMNGLKSLVKELERSYDVVLMDSSPSLGKEMLATMLASDELLVITSPDYPTLSCTLRAVKIAKEKKTPITGLILNKTRGKEYEISIKDIEEMAGVPVLAVLPDDYRVQEAIFPFS